MENNLQETIEEILAELLDIEWGEEMSIRDDYLISGTEAILQAVRDVVPPEIKVDKNSNCVIGWNACRTEILEELGGGNEYLDKS